jgi:hypothetical protein
MSSSHLFEWAAGRRQLALAAASSSSVSGDGEPELPTILPTMARSLVETAPCIYQVQARNEATVRLLRHIAYVTQW